MPVLSGGILAIIVGVRIFREFLVGGIKGINYFGNILFIVGWGLGHVLAEADHWFYALMCNPQELSCLRVRSELQNRRFSSAWAMLKATAPERTRLPIHNVITGLIVAVMGVWVVTSLGNLLASGLVVGLSVKLYMSFITDPNFSRWYWLIAREFSPTEHRTVKWVWGLLLVWQAWGLLR